MRSFTWRLFGMFVAAPALLLAWFGLSAVRAERLEGEQQLRDQQSEVGRLADAAIASTLATLARELPRGDSGAASEPQSDPPVGTAVAFDASGLLTFRRDKVYFGQFAQHPPERVTSASWPPDVSTVIEQAQTAEAQGRFEQALVLLSRLRRAEPRLQSWADIVAVRISLSRGGSESLNALITHRWSESGATTPSGLPVAFLASALSAERAPEQRRAFLPLIRGSQSALREGRWWLSAEERRFYDRELTRMVKEAGGGTVSDTDGPPANRLTQLTEIEQVVRQSPPSRRDMPSYGVERGARTAYLMIWSPYDAAAREWRGLAVPQERASLLIGPPLERLFAGLSFQAVVRDTGGGRVWGPPLTDRVWRTEALRAIRGWEIAFTGPSKSGQIARRQRLWYGFIGLLLIVLFGGIGMTAQNLRQQTALARMQSEFVAAVTHEFKSPITSIRLLLERISTGRLTSSDAAAAYASAIGREADRLERLVNRLLQAQQIDTGQQRHDFAEASLEEVTTEVVRQIQPLADAKGIRIDIEVAKHIPPVVIDRAIIADAVENLVDNAIKYSPPATRILVRLSVDGGRACVDVEDQGIGIDADEIPRVFDKFYRARRGNLQNVRGTGLGLALVKAAAEAHGGRVDVASEPRKGSRFSLRLPLSAQSANMR